MGKLFDLENPFWMGINKLTDIFLLGLLWVICCIPIVTVGASTTAAYYTMFKVVRNEENYIFRTFFRAFKENFKQATVLWLILLGVYLVLIADISFYRSSTWQYAYILQGVLFAVLIAVFLMGLYLFPLLARFYQKNWALIKFSIGLSLRHLLRTILVALLAAAALVLSYMLPPLCFLFGAFYLYGSSAVLLKIFGKYVKPQEEETHPLDEMEKHIEEEKKKKKKI